MTRNLILTFYGDDFTGSTDAMEQLEMAGMPTVLFLDVPTDEQLSNFPDVQAVGIAGISRSMSPEAMDQELSEKFAALAKLRAPFFHYKVCSTFDSSPTVGSIGHAIDIGWDIFNPKLVPLIVGAPFLRRYVAFGNLFARVDDTTYRLDRHPTMSQHPITPMNEADLRLHLGKQTHRQIGLVDYWHMLSKTPDELDQYIESGIQNGDEIIVFDTLDDDHLKIIGRILWDQQSSKTVFIVGSSGVEKALGLHLRQGSIQDEQINRISPGAVPQMIVISGSAAPETADQIRFALRHGFVGIPLDVPALIDPATEAISRQTVIEQALAILVNGASVILYSALGPDDPTIQKTRDHAESIGLPVNKIAQRLGEQQGLIAKGLLEASEIRRICVAGGDTSGHTAHQLGIYALRAVQAIAPGAPLCRASSTNPQLDGLEIALKGGQNGKVDYFYAILQGQA